MARARDPFLDGLRAVSVVRVVLLHLLQHVSHPFVATFSFFMPGMPLMFFVSGALAASGLDGADGARRRRFWRERARRLLVPFWAFGATILLVCAVGALAFRHDPAHAFPFRTLAFWVLPLAGPQASAAFDELDWHLWFLSALILLLASAPWTLALHKRAPFVGALVFLGAGAGIEIARSDVPGVLRNTLLFGAAFQFGFGYTDGRLRRARGELLLGIAGVLAICALLFHAERAPNQMIHAEPLALLALGLAFVALWMRVRAVAVGLFELGVSRRWISAINARAYTIFLWGPIANDVAGRLVRPRSGAEYLVEFATSLAFLCVLVKLFGPVEDWAARRTRRPAAAAGAAGAARTA
ncbi:MAG: acyltransferase family protein [Planctomycetes bacterium]|nr:acyltransferase family protein [Planctomycetota bacterium]